METLGSILSVVVFAWLILGLIKPAKAAPFLKKPSRFKVLGIAIIGFIIAGALLPKTATNSTNSAQTQKKIYTMGELYPSKNFEIAILDKEVTPTVTDKSGYLSSKADGTFIVLTVQYKNVANTAMRLDNSAFKLKLGDKTYAPVTVVATSTENIFLDSINPGIQKTGKLYFDVPNDVANSNDFILKMSSSFISDNSSGEIALHK